MQLRLKHLGKLFKATFKEWWRKDPFRESAVIAYYAIFAIPGLLFLILITTGKIFGQAAVNENIVRQATETMGTAAGDQIREMLEKTGTTESTLFGTIVGIVVLLLGATGVFVELQKALNAIWQVKVEPKKGIWPILRARLFSFGLIMAIAFLLLISLVISTALAAIGDWISADSSPFMMVVFTILNFAISLCVISVLFGLMFKVLPDAKIKWRHVWFGALLTGLLFTAGKMALAFYFGTANPASAYGAAGSVILILLWVSYSSMILFFGAEFTAAYAQQYSGPVKPTEIAKPDLAQKVLRTL